MQLSGDADLAAAVTAAERDVVHELKIDWALNGLFAHDLSDLSAYVGEVSVDRHLEGALPKEATLTEGFQSAELTGRISGARLSDAQLALIEKLSPWRLDGPLYGQPRPTVPVKWSATVRKPDGSAPLIRQFTGTLTVFGADAEGNIAIAALDGAESLRAAVTLPEHAMVQANPDFERGRDWRINSQWVIDFALRTCGIYQSPPPQTGCLWSSTGHGSMIPDVGFNFGEYLLSGYIFPTSPSWVNGVYGIAVNGTAGFGGVWTGRAVGKFEPISGKSYTFQFKALFGGAATEFHPDTQGYIESVSSGPGGYTMSIRVTATSTLVVEWRNAVSTVVATHTIAAPATSGWHDVAFRCTFGTPLSSSQVRTRIDGVDLGTTAVNLSGLSSAPVTEDYATVIIGAPVPVQCLQICAGTETSWYATTFTSECDLDPGLNEMDSLPIRRAVNAWELIKETAEAEYAVVGFDEYNRPFFRNRNTARRQSLATLQTLTSERALKGVMIYERADSIRNAVALTTTRRWWTRGTEVVYTPKTIGELDVPPGTSVLYVQLDKTAQVYDITLPQYTQANWDLNTTIVDGYVAYNRSLGVEMTVGVTVRVMPDGSLRLTIVNNNNFYARFGFADIAFRISGRTIVEDASVITTRRRDTSVNAYGERLLPLDASDWRQRPDSLEPVMHGLLKDLKRPVAVIDRIPVVGDPRRQILDAEDITEARLGGPIPTQVVGYTRTLSADGGLSEEISVRPFAPPGAWILGHPRYGVLASTTRLG